MKGRHKFEENKEKGGGRKPKFGLETTATVDLLPSRRKQHKYVTFSASDIVCTEQKAPMYLRLLESVLSDAV